MSHYVIFTDSACDLSPILLNEWGVGLVQMTFRFVGEEREYTNAEMPIHQFYQTMRSGNSAKTAAINPDTFIAAFTEPLQAGKDILYLGFSSGLSTTYHASTLAAEELREQYPERTIITLDTLCASAGQGLLVALAAKKQAEGASLEEVATYTEHLIPRICHWFTVDDLVYLKRGGRVSSAVAFVGAVLGIKPVLHVDDAGHLINVSKARGRKAALSALAEKYGELAEDPKGIAYISQADCAGDADILKQQMEERFGATVEVITDIGPVIGAHSGPGTIALFFVGKER